MGRVFNTQDNFHLKPVRHNTSSEFGANRAINTPSLHEEAQPVLSATQSEHLTYL